MRLGLGLGFSSPARAVPPGDVSDISLSATSIAENNSIDDVIGTLSATGDPDATFTFELVSGSGSADNGSFNISGSSLRASEAFNYEAKSSYSIRIRATDDNSAGFREKAFTVIILNVNEAPTDISLSNNTVPEDLAVGLMVGLLTFSDPDAGDTGTFSIVADDDDKFDIRNNELIIDNALDYEIATSHDVMVRFTDAGGLHFDKAFTITVNDIADETTVPPLDDTAITPTYSGTFNVNPVLSKGNGKAKAQGKATTLASLILSIGIPYAGGAWIAQVDPDFSLLSNGGKDALLGFGFKQGNNFQIVGLKGDGSTGLKDAKVTGNWNALASATVTANNAPANGTQAGPNWVKFEVAADGSTYTFSTGTGADIDNVTWTAEYTGASASPLTNVSDASDFGIAAFFPSSDTGQFSIEVAVWSGAAAAALVKGDDATAQNYTTETALPFANEDADVGTIHASDDNTKLTVPAGVSYVRLRGQVGFTNVGASEWSKLRIRKNGADDLGVKTTIGGTSSVKAFHIASPALAVSPGDYFELMLQQQTDTAVNIVGEQTWFAMEKVG